MAFEVKIEADSNDITEHPHDDKPRPYLCTVCDKRFTRKDHLNRHKQIHNVDKVYSCILEENFQSPKFSKNVDVYCKSLVGGRTYAMLRPWSFDHEQ